MKLSTNTFQRLLWITASGSLLGIAGCSTGSSGGEPGQAGTNLPGIFVTSNWSRPGPSYLYDEIATPAGGGAGIGSTSSGGTASSSSSSGGHSGGSSSGGGGASSGGGGSSSGGGGSSSGGGK
jgi:hypothetical protein